MVPIKTPGVMTNHNTIKCIVNVLQQSWHVYNHFIEGGYSGTTLVLCMVYQDMGYVYVKSALGFLIVLLEYICYQSSLVLDG